MAKRKDRTPEEIAIELGSDSSDGEVLYDPDVQVDDTPEPDHDAIAGRTTVGTVDTPGDVSYVGAPELPMSGLDAPAAVPATMENVMTMLVAALQKIAEGQTNSQKAATEALDMAARQTQPDNKFGPAISDFNPQGDLHYPRPKLRCPMFLPWEAEAESLTFEEIELLNLLEDGEYLVRRNDGVKVKIIVKVKMNLNGTPDVLMMNSESAFNDENHWMMPGLTVILRQVLDAKVHTRKAAVQVMTMDERVAAVQSGELKASVGTR